MMKSVLVSLAFLAVACESFNVTRDVHFFLFTRSNPTIGQQLHFGDLNSIRNSRFNYQWPTRFLVHGFQENSKSDINIMTTAAYLRERDHNVIVVDWSAGADTINYNTARDRIFFAGPHLSKYLDFLAEARYINLDQLVIVGHDLGAHLAGVAGKNVNGRFGKIDVIVGLNPAGPTFSVENHYHRLDANDARYVEIVHTDSTNGIGGPIGHADFFANNGNSQPGCILSSCSHKRSVLLFVEAINSNKLVGRRCTDLAEMRSTTCSGVSAAIKDNANVRLSGIFQLFTNRNSPFGMG